MGREGWPCRSQHGCVGRKEGMMIKNLYREGKEGGRDEGREGGMHTAKSNTDTDMI